MAALQRRSLPLELWAIIFQLATYAEPSIGATHIPPDERPLAITTKKALRLVCSSWNELAKGLMFEQIYLSKFEKLEHLVSILEWSKHYSSPERRALGCWVRDIQLNFVISDGIVPVCMIARLIECCSNLTTFSNCSQNSTDVPITPTLVKSLCKSASSSLRKAEFRSWDRDLPSMDDVAQLLASCTSLEALCLGNVLRSAHYPTLQSSTLQALHFAPRIQELAMGPVHDLPNLRHLTILVSPHRHSSRGYQRFLKFRGQDLTSVDCQTIHIDLSYVLDLCRNLEELVFTFPAPPLWPKRPHQSLRRIGIRGFMSPYTLVFANHTSLSNQRTVCEVHFQNFCGDLFPALRCIHIPDGSKRWIEGSQHVKYGALCPVGTHWSSEALRFWFAPLWRRWWEALDRRGIVMEDSAGFPLRFGPGIDTHSHTQWRGI